MCDPATKEESMGQHFILLGQRTRVHKAMKTFPSLAPSLLPFQYQGFVKPRQELYYWTPLLIPRNFFLLWFLLLINKALISYASLFFNLRRSPSALLILHSSFSSTHLDMWGLCEGFLLLVGCHSLFVSEGSSSVHTEQGAEVSKPQSLICAPVVNTNYLVSAPPKKTQQRWIRWGCTESSGAVLCLQAPMWSQLCIERAACTSTSCNYEAYG